MILDQFMASVPAELRMFLKENNIRTLDEAVKRADIWASAHRYYSRYPSVTEPNERPLSTKPSSSKGSPSTSRKSSSVKCHNCGEPGHIRPNCPQNPALFKQKPKSDPSPGNVKVASCLSKPSCQQYYTTGTINGSRVSTIIRDTGCSRILVSEEALPDVDVSQCNTVRCFDYLGRADEFPVVRCFLRCPYFDGWIDAVRAPLKYCSVLVGNVEGVRSPDDPDNTKIYEDTVTPPIPVEVAAVQTRAAAARKIHPLVLSNLEPLSVTPKEFSDLQKACPTLVALRNKAANGEQDVTRKGCTFSYEVSEGLLYRICLSSNCPNLPGKRYLVVPAECRRAVLTLAHESPLAGHLSHRKTGMKIGEQFYWPGMWSDIRSFCQSCDKCQRMSVRGRVKPVPLKQLPIITEPFSRVAVDIVGPLSPPTSEGHRYILTLIDFATGFPEAVPRKEVTFISVAEALLEIFSRVGIPREILSDRGTQFTSQMMSELHRLIGVKPLFTTPYHPSGNGRIERFHSTLKASLRKLCSDKPREWHRYLPAVLFALREMPSDRTGFSAFELLYGRTVRGPLSILRDLWEDNKLTTDDRSCYQYVIELKDKLADCAKIAAENADISAAKYKTYFDLNSQDRQFKPGDEVLVLLPDSTSKLLLAWNGPYTVLERKNRVNYVIEEKGKPKLYHANLLKRYYRRAQVNQAAVLDEIFLPSDAQDAPELTFSLAEPELLETADDLPITPDGRLDQADSNTVPEVRETLTTSQRSELFQLISDFKDVFSEIPGCTSSLQHDIEVCTTERVKPKLYPIPLHLRPFFQQEVEQLLSQGIIKPSTSPHCSPVVMVKKTAGNYRLAVDYRVLNSITVFDAEPITTITEDLHKFYGSRYFSELDLTKAYYQVPLTDRAMCLTAFPTHLGLMEFCRLPFGLVTACATYIRLMRLVLAGLEGVTFYFDNIFIFGSTWGKHLDALNSVLIRLRQHGLTARPSKCRFGFGSIEYLGFIVDGNTLRPQENKVSAISSIPPPSNKKLLRSFLGMISFYRMFIPDAASYTSSLSDLLRKGVPEPLVWTEELQVCFERLKTALHSDPVLRLPDQTRPFVLRTDASNQALGAVLLQFHQDCPHPVAYGSRKLLDRERRYSTIERECLAVVSGIRHFDYYLRGKEFVLEVDHKPLVYLTHFKGGNDRLLRWALCLQGYRFRVVHIAGENNIGGDLLSRSE
ncbi:uncharacterized protein LOC126989430 isoform X2 [Eriocheir sinensis]|uniref:uncharacterized protein LOC126989430 isoform X2 n=1 Tax=Eriocheir sinensis TaxID=95602 RepID=UPI0021C74AC8|nr:uncharacterized protein LOC126989430 isoform X2 [Eriocheir sinensis]